MESMKIWLCLLFITLVYGGAAWFTNQPQEVGADVPAGKLKSLSFAPYHDGYSPIDNTFPLPEHIEGDVRLLADKTHTIRTYSILGGLEPTPGFARQYGIEMIQGGWLGDGPDGNQKEITALIQSVNANADVVKRVIVGNEVLLRNDMTVERLVAYIREVKQAIKQPVSYADVWSIYLKYPQLIKEVDFITLHILPYWEDEPVAIENALAHIDKIILQVQAQMRRMGENKPILIGESGWPAVGRQRGLAVPSVVNEATFIRGLIRLAEHRQLDYNIVEAFNQAWKSHHEGVVGANWGLFSTSRQAVFPLTGPVSEHPHWPFSFAAAVLLCAVVVAFNLNKLAVLPLPRLAALLALLLLMSLCLSHLAEFLWRTSYNTWQHSYAVSVVLANAALAAGVGRRCYDILAKQPPAPVLAGGLRLGYLAFMGLALYQSYILAFNGRYISFPVEQFTIPALGIAALWLCQQLNRPGLSGHKLAFAPLLGMVARHPYDGNIAMLLALGIPALIFGETANFMSGGDFIQAHPQFWQALPVALGYTLYNQQLQLWLLCVLSLIVPFLPWRWQTALALPRA
jgi:exo-beta-1,3-glucanase (GH17 family)